MAILRHLLIRSATIEDAEPKWIGRSMAKDSAMAEAVLPDCPWSSERGKKKNEGTGGFGVGKTFFR